MAAGEVLLNGTQLNDGGTNSAATAANVLDANSLTFWQTNPAANSGYVGMDAGAACQLTRVRISPVGGYEDATLGAFIQGSSSTTFPSPNGVVQANANYINGTNQASVTASFTNNQVGGNANVVFVLASSGAVISGVSDPTNGAYTLLFGPSSNGISCWIFTGIASTSSALTVTVAFSTHCNYPTIAMAEVSGVSGSGSAAMDGNASASGTGTSPSSGSLTTTNATDLILSVVGGGGSPNISAGTGFTMNKNLGPTWDTALESQAVTSTGAYTGSFSFDASNNWNCTTVALKLTGTTPNVLQTISQRPTSGTLLQEYDILSAPSFRYFRYAAPSGSNGYLGDLDFIVEYTAGVVASAVAPTILPTSRYFDEPTVIRLSSITTDASIYYTTDGTTPSPSSNHYLGPFVISSSCTLKAVAVSPGLANSRVTSTKIYIKSDFNSLNSVIDNRNYPVWAVSPSIFQGQDGYWYWYGANFDQNGVYTYGRMGDNVYRSADLRNWTFIANVMGPGAGQQINNQNSNGRQCIAWNNSTQNYVCWSAGQYNNSGQHFQVFTSPSPIGPWTLQAQYVSFNGYSFTGDMCFFVDSDGATAYIVFDSNTASVFQQLNSSWTNANGTFTTYTTSSTFGIAPPDGGGGLNLDGPHMFKRGSTYFFLCNAQNEWAPTLNPYATASSPLGPWTNGGNPFIQQPGVGNGNPDYTLAYNSQNCYPIYIPGRNLFIYTGDSYNTGLAGNVGTSNTANFEAWVVEFLPITFPTPTTMQIGWNPNWHLDDVAPTLSGAPAPATGLSVLEGFAQWTNNEPNPSNIYLDGATDPGISQNVVSEVLAPGATSFSVAIPRLYYRVRTVNANGTGYSPVVQAFNPPPSSDLVYVSKKTTSGTVVWIGIPNQTFKVTATPS